MDANVELVALILKMQSDLKDAEAELHDLHLKKIQATRDFKAQQKKVSLIVVNIQALGIPLNF